MGFSKQEESEARKMNRMNEMISAGFFVEIDPMPV
jgi:hypothetical protein